MDLSFLFEEPFVKYTELAISCVLSVVALFVFAPVFVLIFKLMALWIEKLNDWIDF